MSKVYCNNIIYYSDQEDSYYQVNNGWVIWLS